MEASSRAEAARAAGESAESAEREPETERLRTVLKNAKDAGFSSLDELLVDLLTTRDHRSSAFGASVPHAQRPSSGALNVLLRQTRIRRGHVWNKKRENEAETFAGARSDIEHNILPLENSSVCFELEVDRRGVEFRLSQLAEIIDYLIRDRLFCVALYTRKDKVRESIAVDDAENNMAWTNLVAADGTESCQSR